MYHSTLPRITQGRTSLVSVRRLSQTVPDVGRSILVPAGQDVGQHAPAALGVARLGLHAVGDTAVGVLDDKLAATLGDVGRLGAVGAATTGRLVEKLAADRLEDAAGASHHASRNVRRSHLVHGQKKIQA